VEGSKRILELSNKLVDFSLDNGRV